MTWQNRIVGYGEEPPDQLLANPRNWRTHPASQTDALAGVLRETGWVQNVIVNRTTGFVVDGHARIALALRDGQPTVPITYVELDEAEEALILASLDPIAALAGADAAKLDDLLREVSTGEAAVQQLLADLAEQRGLPTDEAPAPAGVDVVPEQWLVMIECDDEGQQAALLERLSDEGYRCRALTS